MSMSVCYVLPEHETHLVEQDDDDDGLFFV